MATSPLVLLQTVASNAAVAGASLSKFDGQVPDATTELRGIVSGLFGLSSSMHHFESAARNYGSRAVSGEMSGHIHAVSRDTMSIVKELEGLIQEMDIASTAKGTMQKNILKDITWDIKEKEGSMRTRLETHKEAMSLMLARLHANASSQQATSPLYEDFDRRLNFQDFGSPTTDSSVDFRSPGSPLSGLSSEWSTISPITPFDDRASSFSQRLYENPYFDRGYVSALPPNPHFVPPPRPKTSFVPRNSEFVQYVEPMDGSDGSNSSQSSDYRYKYAQGPVPPMRPSYQRRKSQPNIHKLSLNVFVDNPPLERRPSKLEHWSGRVFDGILSNTKFPETNVPQMSKCNGKPMEVFRKEGEVELLKMKFAPDFIVRFWRCERTQKTRVVCQVGRRSSQERYHSDMDMARLTIWRSGPLLELKFKSTVWASLLFGCIEDLVIFYNTFLVLRQLGRSPPELDVEVDMDDEVLLYSGLISDDEGGEHFLRVFRDDDTGAVRLAAYIKGGEHHQVPVWTSFVSGFIFKKGWLARHFARVQLDNIHLISFSEMYATKAYRNWELLFRGREDAKDFEKVFKNDLRQAT